jgi:putative ABC transport system permease protein
MKFTALLAQSLRNIWSNKVRSALTILGVVIGIAAVIYLVGVGNGLQSNVTSKISGLGVTRINVRSQPPGPQTVQTKKGLRNGGGSAASLGNTTVASLSDADYQTVKQTRDVVEASPEANAQVGVATIANAQTAVSYQLYGVDADYFGMESFQAEYGSLLSQHQVNSSSNVVVLGDQAAKDLFPSNSNPVGQTLYIQNTAFTVIGTIQEPSTTSPLLGGDPASNLYTGYNEWSNVTGDTKFNGIIANASSQNTVNSVASSITASLTKAHDITNTNDSDFNVSTNQAAA